MPRLPHTIECPTCEGEARAYSIDRYSGERNYSDWEPCPTCGWAGVIEEEPEREDQQ